MRLLPRPRKIVLPRGFANQAVVEIPKRLKNIAVIQQQADIAGKRLPHQCVNLLLGIQTAQGLQKMAETAALRAQYTGRCFFGISSIKSNPQHNKAVVQILICGAGGFV